MNTLKMAAAVFLVTTSASAQELPRADAEFAQASMERIELGQLLFYDPILSGNKNISCGTCHHPSLGTADGVSLGIGEGGVGLGLKRALLAENLPEARIPRNAPALWNLGAGEFTVMFHDGRVEADAEQPYGVRTPLGDEMVAGFNSVLAAQAMFPVLSADEMAGHFSENDVSRAVRMGQNSQEGGAWDIIAARVDAIPAYRAMFDTVIGSENEIKYVDIANALADFIAFEWRSDNSAFDQHLRGEITLDGEAMAGLELFYGAAGCASCHSGQFQTDHDFHAMAMPQIGPGKAAAFEDHARDVGRQGVTGDAADAYAFRTPSLRNLSVTAPYGHAGGYADLRAVIAHHANPSDALQNYTLSSASLPDFADVDDSRVVTDPEEVARIAQALGTRPTYALSEGDIDLLLVFLATLEDTQEGRGRLGVPETVPSGLALDQ